MQSKAPQPTEPWERVGPGQTRACGTVSLTSITRTRPCSHRTTQLAPGFPQTKAAPGSAGPSLSQRQTPLLSGWGRNRAARASPLSCSKYSSKCGLTTPGAALAAAPRRVLSGHTGPAAPPETGAGRAPSAGLSTPQRKPSPSLCRAETPLTPPGNLPSFCLEIFPETNTRSQSL